MDRVFCNYDTLDLTKSFVGSMHIFSDNATTSSKSLTIFLYPVHAVLLNFCEEYKKKLIQSTDSCVAFLPVENGKSKGVREADIYGPRESVNGYFTFQILDAEEAGQVTSGTEGKETKMRTLYQSMRTVLDYL